MLQSVSVFAPIANPSESKVGQKAFKGYLGEDRSLWEVSVDALLK
jgi:S-formylglutathione hydrolase